MTVCDANFRRKPNEQYHTENQGKKDIVNISSILQRQKIPEGIRINLENHSSPTAKSKKPHLSQPKTFIKKTEN